MMRLVLLLLLLLPSVVQAQFSTIPEWKEGSYLSGALVKFNGTMWICGGVGLTCNLSPGVTPSQWNSMAGYLAWDSGTNYEANTMVIRQGTTFTAIVPSLGVDPAGGLNPTFWKARGIPDGPTFTDTTLMQALKAPTHTLQFSGMTPDPCPPAVGNRASVLLGANVGTSPLIEFVNGSPRSYSDCSNIGPASSGFIIYGNQAASPGQSAPISIFLSGWYNNGAGVLPASLEIENKANWDGDGKPQLWFEIPTGQPKFQFVDLGTVAGGVRTANGIPGGSITFQGWADTGGPYTPVARIQNASTPYFQLPQLTGVGNASLCVDSTGKVFRGSPGC